jgi:hypothetical protein
MTTELGWWPYDTLVSWASDDLSSMAAEVGWSAGPDIYDNIDARMLRTPQDSLEAYEQAVFWLSVAARRADFNQEKEAQARLVDAKRAVEARKSQLATNWLCTTTGYGCSGEGASDILGYAITEIRASGLNSADRNKIVGYLGSSKFYTDARRALPWAAAGTAVALGIFALRARQK